MQSNPDYRNLHYAGICPIILHEETGVTFPVVTLSQYNKLMYASDIPGNCIQLEHPDFGYDIPLPKYEHVKKTDVQCIVGARIMTSASYSNYTHLNIHNLKQTYYWDYRENMISSNIGYVRHPNETVTMNWKTRDNRDFIYREKGYKYLSVMYITRKDGLINHDIYFRWCHETGLPFPEDMVHTSENLDVALSTIKGIGHSMKSSYSALGIIDSIRKKKVYPWAIPYISGTKKNIKKEDIKVFSRMSKSSAKRPWTIMTYTKRLDRRLRRARNRHK